MTAPKQSSLTIERLREVLNYDKETGLLSWRVDHGMGNCFPAGTVAGWISQGYARVAIDGHTYVAHRVVWFHVNGVWPTGYLDHRNGIKSDNRIDNLREATRSQNEFNTGPRQNNLSGFKGVSPHKKRWIAQIECDGKHYYLGLFKDATSAAFEHDKAAIKLHGEFAVLNFPERRAEHQIPSSA